MDTLQAFPGFRGLELTENVCTNKKKHPVSSRVGENASITREVSGEWQHLFIQQAHQYANNRLSATVITERQN